MGALRDLLALPRRELVLHRVTEAVAGVVEGDELDPPILEVLVPQELVEPRPEEPVTLLGEHDVYGPALAKSITRRSPGRCGSAPL